MVVSLGTVTLNASEIVPIRKKSMIHHAIPTRNGDRLQNMGLDSRSWEMKVDLIGTNKDTDKATLEGYFTDDTSVTFTYGSDTYTVKVELFSAVENQVSTKWDIRLTLVEED